MAVAEISIQSAYTRYQDPTLIFCRRVPPAVHLGECISTVEQQVLRGLTMKTWLAVVNFEVMFSN
jgi:hypothetical protein